MASGHTFTPNTAPAGSPDYSALPPAVRAAAARADQLAKGQGEPQAQPEPPAQQPTQQAEPPAQQPAQQPTPQPAPKPQQAQPPAQQPTQQAEPDEDWKQKYYSLQGQFNALNRASREWNTEREQLLLRIEELEAREPSAAPSGDEAFDVRKVLTADEAADWGDDWAAVMTKVVNEATRPLHERIAQLQGTATTMVKRGQISDRDAMHTTLDNDVPEWQDINVSEDFVNWVNKKDEASGKARHTLLKEAYEKNETQRVKHFFTTFLREVRGVSPEAQHGQDNGGQGRAAAPKSNDLTQYAAPGRGKQAAPQPQAAGDEAEPATISRQEISAFYMDKARGQLKISAEEAEKFEKQIDRAQRENRIV